ncbi:DNA topology modulation protein [Clostridium sp. AL.422]|uniref:DNA topology modulation protein n=1 Tax=Clostridium TaxID=1485 RepID=UPI00293DE989|nr:MULTISPECIES: DNA topology modulation protein [unclassified Clostridium]MDV4149290.1 DNA topology modulation protein [Clostridium sp. AL.422]
MDRVIIIGCGGSGKSTLSRVLSEKTNLPVVHLDKLFWREGWVNISREEFKILLREELKKDKWIIDGNYDSTIKERLNRCDTVIYLDYPRRTCLFGVVKRFITNYGKVRPDMTEGCPEKIHLEFIKWIWNFNKVHRDKFYKILKEEKGKEIYIFRNRKECNEFIKKL